MVPLFTGIVVLPTLFNVVRPGTPLLVLFHLSQPLKLGYWTIFREVAITQEGVAAAVLLILRVGASVSLAVLLTLTTRWHDAAESVKRTQIPAVFLTVLEMTYRYIFLLLLRALTCSWPAGAASQAGRTPGGAPVCHCRHGKSLEQDRGLE